MAFGWEPVFFCLASIPPKKRNNPRLGVYAHWWQTRRGAETDQGHIGTQAGHPAGNTLRVKTMRRNDNSQCWRDGAQSVQGLVSGLQTGFASVQCLCLPNTSDNRHGPLL